ncbi:PaaI family thioesterase [Rhodococcus sp. (in: high G+C Gram-positive bacteria)]|uniref:PaaI family thioesterase n=1 Tax=Rhodococcus sp. TaxID=1831 RepID=UPI00257FC4B0|nr:PaaI family thioesterase [Rhodococcus sp. (in: high G+C Gram-positive bacteria)]MBQ9056470.1 PaaI family thioesterase [Rhodococcus sp. (in: high G+C Gram-positive bacteria)]
MTAKSVAWGAKHQRNITWHDPAPSTAAGLTLPGLDYLTAMLDGELPPPPINGLTNMELVEVIPGRAVFTCEPGEWGYNPIGTVHGGIVCTLLDTVCGCALHSTLPAGQGFTSVEIKVSYLRPVHASSGVLTATGTLVKAGSRMGFTEGVVTDSQGKVVATASSTLLISTLPQ